MERVSLDDYITTTEGHNYIRYYSDNSLVAVYVKEMVEATENECLYIFVFETMCEIWMDKIENPGLHDDDIMSDIEEYVSEWLQERALYEYLFIYLYLRGVKNDN